MKKLQERVRNQIENKIMVCAAKGNKGSKELVLNKGDWVWLLGRIDFLLRESPNLAPEVMALFKSLRG